MTRRELYEQGRAMLEEANVPDAAYDAYRLFEWASGISHAAYLADPDIPVDPDTKDQYLKACSGRSERIPLQHLIGEQEFMGLLFHTGPEALVPRSDTEVLVETVLDWLAAHDDEIMVPQGREREILDLGCGTGCILISLLHVLDRRPQECFSGTAADISEEALKLARHNACLHDMETRIHWRRSEWFSEVPEKDFSVIVSNPPYIAHDVISTLEPEVAEHEPRQALDGGRDGLDAYRQIITEAPDHLAAGGLLAVEIGWDQGETVSSLFEANGFLDVKVIRDLSGQDRVVIGQKRSRQ